MALKRLHKEYKELLKDVNYLYSIALTENPYIWEFVIIGPEDTLYEGGIFNGSINFPRSYPNESPQIKFSQEMYHPNIYKDGRVCISILHNGSDEFGYEHDSERWSPTQNVNTIMLSIISMLSSPNFDSPANVDIGILYKQDYNKYKQNIYKIVSKSQNT